MTDKEIGDFIRQRREDLHLTLIQIANKMGVSKSTVSRWETGDIKKIKKSHLLMLSDLLYFPIDLFFGENIEIESAEIILKRKDIIKKLNTIKDVQQLNQINLIIDTFIKKEN